MAERTRRRTTVDDFLAAARERITRLDPAATADAVRRGARIIDIRGDANRREEGVIPDSVHIPLSVLPWRVDPDAELTDDRVNDLDQHLVIMCNEGYSSSWAAAVLVELGFTNVSDLDGGFRAWAAQGHPTASVDDQAS